MKHRFIVYVLVLLAFALSPLFIKQKDISEQENILHSFSATCVVSTASGRGTGIFVDTGYVLTARHVVDEDGDRVISQNERMCRITTFDGESYQARVVLLGRYDFAILEVINFANFNTVKASIRKPMLGEKIYTIGSTAGHQLHITDGYISLPELGHSRASCFISVGNSGGAIFDSDGESLGVVVSVGIRRMVDTIQFALPVSEDRTMLVVGNIMRQTEVNSLCLFVQMSGIRHELEQRSLGFLLDVQPQPSFFEKHFTRMVQSILLSLCQVSLFLISVFYVRRHIFN